ncbi:MAG TPA: DUF6580 family putative transport protein, partial [Candidatus Acidoferrales bacterium]|nr:DUF6580 family putative transport protein [Candidatus Acidoferrales bacterium]
GRLRIPVLMILILAAAAARIGPHPWNFAPVGAMALFSGAMLRDRRLAFGFPLAAMLAGDCVIGFHILMPVVYASFLLSVGIGRWLAPSRTVGRVAAGTLAGSIQFFLLTNFAVWLVPGVGVYPKTMAGLLACYVAGIPFFWNTLAGDAFYVALLFGGFALAERRFAMLREPALAV